MIRQQWGQRSNVIRIPRVTGTQGQRFNFLVYIIDDDDPELRHNYTTHSGFRIGFERTSYIVNERIGTLEVCVRMFEPPEDTSLGPLTVSIGVETVQGSAGIVYVEMLLQYCMSV